MTVHDAIAALPTAGGADHALIRTLVTKRLAYCLDGSEAATSLTVVDPDTGALPLYLIQNGNLFKYDSTDSTTANDGVTCLVSVDGKRYKTSSIVAPYSVLSKTTSAPPGSPTNGDAYLVPTAATGAWVGKDNQIAIYTASGWQFITYPLGKLLFIADTTTYWHRDATSGLWVAGVGSFALTANSVAVSNIIGKPVRWVVVNQTTNAPPGSPSVGDAYIIGGSPTGAWAGNAGKIAICESGSTFTIYTPRTGELAYDVAQGNDFRYSGTAWVSAGGSIVGTGVTQTGFSTLSRASGGIEDTTCALTYKARKTSAILKFEYRFQYSIGGIANNNDAIAIGLFRDSETTSIDQDSFAWYQATAISPSPKVTFEMATNDANSHTYTVKVFNASSSGLSITFSGPRRLRVFELA